MSITALSQFANASANTRPTSSGLNAFNRSVNTSRCATPAPRPTTGNTANGSAPRPSTGNTANGSNGSAPRPSTGNGSNGSNGSYNNCWTGSTASNSSNSSGCISLGAGAGLLGGGLLAPLGQAAATCHTMIERCMQFCGCDKLMEPFDLGVVHPLIWNPISQLTGVPNNNPTDNPFNGGLLGGFGLLGGGSGGGLLGGLFGC